MSKLNRVQKIVLGVIVTFVALGIVLKVVGGSASAGLGYDGLTMLKYALIDHPIETITSWTKDFANLWSVKEENDQLRYELSKNPSYKAKYVDNEQSLNELKKALEIDQSDERFSHAWTEVIARDVSTWNNTITINKGSDDGIKKNLAVTSVDGLVGKVTSVSKKTSIVKLLTSEDKLNTVSIKILIDKEISSQGILESYDVKKGRYVITLFDDSTEIKKGMQVTTSGNGGVYPSGLLIGTVETVQALTNQTGQTIYVKPIDNFQSFSYVSVIVPKGEE